MLFWKRTMLALTEPLPRCFSSSALAFLSSSAGLDGFYRPAVLAKSEESYLK